MTDVVGQLFDRLLHARGRVVVQFVQQCVVQSTSPRVKDYRGKARIERTVNFGVAAAVVSVNLCHGQRNKPPQCIIMPQRILESHEILPPFFYGVPEGLHLAKDAVCGESTRLREHEIGIDSPLRIG